MPNLVDKLKADLSEAHRQLNEVREQEKLLRFKVSYIQTLLGTKGTELPAEAGPDIDEGNNVMPVSTLSLHSGIRIADAAALVLEAADRPLSSMNIARLAIQYGYTAENIERARSHFSAVISKDLKSSSPRFWQVGRALIGLVEWKDQPRFRQLAGHDLLG